MSVSPQLRALGPEIRILAAFIDAWADHNWAIWETALLTESKSEGWNFSKTERLLQRRGWRSVEDIYEAAGIQPNHWIVLDLDTRGYEERDICRHTGHDRKTVYQWLERDRAKLRRLDFGDFEESSGY